MREENDSTELNTKEESEMFVIVTVIIIIITVRYNWYLNKYNSEAMSTEEKRKEERVM